MKNLLLILPILLLFSCTHTIQKQQEIKTYIKNISFFTQAPLNTDINWKIHRESCEEASILIYTAFLDWEKYNENTFDEELIKMKDFQVEKYWIESDIKKYELKDFINDYFSELQAKVVLNLNKQKITWLLDENKPVLIWINASDIDNPYYHYARYHTLLIVWETKYDYIIKDVWTKKGDDWYYPKDEIIKAINNTWKWWILIDQINNDTLNTDSIKEWIWFNYSTFQSKSYYNDLILDEHNWINIDLPADIWAGIIAHHLTVWPYFDNYFRELKEVKPDIKTFILAGTNHFNFDEKIYSTDLDYKTPFWILEINHILQNNIKSITIDNSILYNEHSIHSIVWFIKKYYPDSKILPFIINENISKEELDKLKVELLENYSTNDYFYLQSTDFTHFQPQYATDFYDLYSKNILDDFDTDRVDMMMVDSRKLQYFTFELLEDLWLKKHFNLINSSSNNFFWIENFLNTSHFFSYFGEWENINKSEQLSVLFTWDMILNYDIPESWKITETGKKENIAYPFDKIDSYEETFFRGYDEIIMNIEWNIWEETFEKDIKNWPIYFKFDDDWLWMIKNVMKANVVFFSNNHLRDFWWDYIEKTKEFVEKAWLEFVWVGTWFFPDKNVYKRNIWSKELIVININDVVTPLFDYDLELLEKYIVENKKENTVIMIYVHWGREYELIANKRQIELGHKFIDYWADLVVWTHSHTIQNKEEYKWKNIYYSLWNLTYDSIRQPMYIPEVEYGMFLWVNFHNDKVDFFEIPYKIQERRPIILIEEEKEKVLKYLK